LLGPIQIASFKRGFDGCWKLWLVLSLLAALRYCSAAVVNSLLKVSWRGKPGR
jgi:hypothetical protein